MLGDLDGVDALLFALLSQIGMIEVIGPSELRWLGGDDDYVVQCGDQIDSLRVNDRTRGSAVTPELDLHVLLLTDYLASISDGHFISIVGNHEWMNVYGEFNYVHPSHADLNRAALFQRDKIMGRILRRRKVMFRINDVLFSHAGLTSEAVPPEFAKTRDLDGLIEAVNVMLAHDPIVFDGKLAKLVDKTGVDAAAAMPTVGGADDDDDDDDGDDDGDDGDVDDADAVAKENRIEEARLWFGTVWDPELRGGLKDGGKKPGERQDMVSRGSMWTRWLRPDELLNDRVGRLDLVPPAFESIIRVQVTGHNKNHEYPGRMEMVVQELSNSDRRLRTNDEIAKRPLSKSERAVVNTDTMPVGGLDPTSLAFSLRYLKISWPAPDEPPRLESVKFSCGSGSSDGTAAAACPRISLKGILSPKIIRDGESLWIDDDAHDKIVVDRAETVRSFVQVSVVPENGILARATEFGQALPDVSSKGPPGNLWWRLPEYAGNPLIAKKTARAALVREIMTRFVIACRDVGKAFASSQRYVVPKRAHSVLLSALALKSDLRKAVDIANSAIELWETAATSTDPPSDFDEYTDAVAWIRAAMDLLRITSKIVK